MPRSVPISTLVSLLAVLAVAAPSPARADARVLNPEDLVDLRHVGDVRFAPGGERVAFLLEVPRTADEAPGKSHVELWLSEPGRAARPFAGQGRRVEDPQWSPDGRTISYLADDPADDVDAAVLWAIPADGGEPRRLAAPGGSIAAHRWSPDGRRIALVVGDPRTDQERADEAAGRDWKVADASPKYRRVWVHDVEGGTTRRWLDADLHVLDVVWLPDGSGLIVRAAPTPRVDDDYMFSRFYRSVDSGELRPLVETEGKLGAMAVSPDGARVAWLGATTLNDPLAQSLFVAPLAGGESRNLTDGSRGSATALAWIDDATLLLVANERERSALFRVDATTGERRSIPWPRLAIDHVSLDGAGRRLAVAASSPQHPAELFVLELAGGEPVRRTRVNPFLDDVRLAPQEVIRWTAEDGTEISGVLTHPLGRPADQQVPLVLQVHGGPEGVSRDGWTSSPLYPVQLLAARGFAVLQPNYRGSGGRGVAFSQADHDDLGGKEFGDILAGIDALVARGRVDPERVGTGGWSYGGYLSAWAATRHSERFRASIVGAGLTHWISFAGTTDIPYEMSLVHWNSWWFDRPRLHWERSPLAHLDRAATPTLIVHGERDERVHPEQGLELYTALRIKQVPTSMVTYPREPHGLDERAHRMDFMERALDWFDRWLQPNVERPRDPEAAR